MTIWQTDQLGDLSMEKVGFTQEYHGNERSTIWLSGLVMGS
jgi:hypothetical protein